MRKTVQTAIIFLLSAFFAGGAFSLPAQEKPVQFVPLEFKNAEFSDQFRSGRLAERFHQIAIGAVPRRKNSWVVRIELCSEKEVQHFEVIPDAKGKRELRIKVPLAFESWRDDVQAHNWLMSILLLAQLGEKFEPDGRNLSYRIQNHWLVRGLARKAAADTLFVLRPFARSYAAAYALFANGRKVPLDRVVYGSPENDRHLAAVAEMESEFAWLLVEASENAGFFRQKLAAPVLQDALVSTDADPWKSFLRHGLEKNLFSGRDPGEWYNTFVERRLLSMLTPLSVEFFETCYREVTTLTFKDPDGAESTCTLTGLVENWQSFPNPNGVIDDLLLKLSLLAHRAPAGMQLPLGTVRQALSRLRTEQTPEVQAQIAGAEAGLFEALRKRIELERYLADAEARHISPADRFLRTLKAAEAARRETNFLLPAIQKKLDEWDEYR